MLRNGEKPVAILVCILIFLMLKYYKIRRSDEITRLPLAPLTGVTAGMRTSQSE